MFHADSALIRSLYADLYIERIAATRSVAAKGHQLRVADVIITNFDASAHDRDHSRAT